MFASVPLPAVLAVFPQRVLQQVTLKGLRKLFWLQLPVLLLRWSSVYLVRRLVFHLVWCFSSGTCGFGQLPLPQVACLRILPPYAWPATAPVASVGLQLSPCVLSSSPAPAGLLGFAGFFTLCQGAPMGAVTALWVTVWGCLLTPHSSQALFLALSSPPAVLTLYGCCALFTAWFTLP